MEARSLTANRLALDIGVPSGRITDILGAKRGITADTALRLARYFANTPQFWMTLQVQYELAIAEQQSGREIARRVRVA
jgi:addiction module HigA family antidote